MAWIETTPPDDARGLLREIYDAARSRAGKVFHVVRLSSLHPELLQAWVELYTRLLHGPSPLTRCEREMVAVVVSKENRCLY